MTQTEALKPNVRECPCCGGTEVLYTGPETPIYCKSCGLRALDLGRWNTRPSDTQTPTPLSTDEQIEAVARAIDPEWWAWADVHFMDGHPADELDREASLARGRAALTSIQPAQGVREALLVTQSAVANKIKLWIITQKHVAWPDSDYADIARAAILAMPQGEKERAFCETCGADVPEVLCPKCAKWWADNPPPEIDAAQVRSMILDETADWGSQKAVAARIGVSPSFLSDVLLSRREPGPKVAKYFELEPVTLYRALTSEQSR